jgi:hypothetical protein
VTFGVVITQLRDRSRARWAQNGAGRTTTRTWPPAPPWLSTQESVRAAGLITITAASVGLGCGHLAQLGNLGGVVVLHGDVGTNPACVGTTGM